ncbi:MAG: sigma-70 family RNA polymerase sigma factor [bacterium]
MLAIPADRLGDLLRPARLLCDVFSAMDEREARVAVSPEARIDHDLVARANRGDAEAFEALYRRHRDWVVGVARRYTTSPDDALDTLQDTFAYFFAKFPGFELTAALRSFLFPVVKHVALSRKRKDRPHDDLATIPERHLGVRPGEPSEIETLLAELPETHRDVVWLRFADDMSLKDIAVALDIPLGTVKSRLHNGLEMIRERHASSGVRATRASPRKEVGS